MSAVPWVNFADRAERPQDPPARLSSPQERGRSGRPSVLPHSICHAARCADFNPARTLPSLVGSDC